MPRHDLLQDAALDHALQRRRRVFGGQQFEHFPGDALARQALERRRRGDAGGIPGLIDIARPEAGLEAEKTQDAQDVLGDALGRVADEAHAPGLEVAEARLRIVQGAVGVGVKCVDGQIAPRRVGQPVVGVGDHGAPPVGLEIAAQGGDFDGLRFGHGGHRTVLDAGG